MFVLLIFSSFLCIYVFAQSDPAYLVNGQVHIAQPMKKPGHVHAGNVKVKRPQQILKAAKAEASETVETIDLSPSEVGIPLEPPYRSVNLGAVELDIPGLGGVQDVQVQSGADLFDYNAEDSPQEIVYEPVIIRRPIYVRPTMPPPKNDCYVNDSGYTCCNGDLETTMHTAYGALKASPNFNECNIGLMAGVVQKAAQKRFRLSFETVVSLKPFGAFSDYEGNYTCKFERDGKYFYSYATPVQYDIEDNTQEKALSNADVTHDEKNPSAVSEMEKEEKVEVLNKALPTVSSTGIRAPGGGRIARSISTNVQEPTCDIRFSKTNKIHGNYVTHEVSMGPSHLSKKYKKLNRSC